MDVYFLERMFALLLVLANLFFPVATVVSDDIKYFVSIILVDVLAVAWFVWM
ncbi:hypothetical protein ACVR1G_08330 [Streptococcus dentasini]